jgi:DNA repair exonuclease SbcCD ATPase subunit
MRRRLLEAGVALLTIPLLASCADLSELDLCGQFADLDASVQELQSMDLMTATAEEIRGQVEQLRRELDQLQAVSEGRLDTAISRLRAEVDAIRQAALDSAGAAALENARAQLTEVQANLANAWALLEDRVTVQCGNP